MSKMILKMKKKPNLNLFCFVTQQGRVLSLHSIFKGSHHTVLLSTRPSGKIPALQKRHLSSAHVNCQSTWTLRRWISKQTLVLMLGRHQQGTAGDSWGLARSKCSPRGPGGCQAAAEPRERAAQGRPFCNTSACERATHPMFYSPSLATAAALRKTPRNQAPRLACSCTQAKWVLVRHLRAEIWKNLEVDAARAQPLSSDPQQWYLTATQSLAVSWILLFSITPPWFSL